MNDVFLPALKQRLWQKMQGDLAKFVPDVVHRERLMCCACGRFLPFEEFDIDHIIPRQTIRQDPVKVRENPNTPANTRAGTILLCTKQLHYKGSRFHGRGCNSWKGKHFDGPMTEIFTGKVHKPQNRKAQNAHIIGGLALAYLAAVAEYGYIIALMRSGLILREQFFNPNRFHKALGTKFHVILTGEPQQNEDDSVWRKPFAFNFEEGSCLVTVRNFVVYLPISQDPSAPIARHLPIVPARYAFRPNFATSLT